MLITKDPVVVIKNKFEKGADRRGLSFSLSEEFILGLLAGNNRCYLSGLPLYYNNSGDNNISIDRLDSSKPYSIDNVRLCHKTLNLMKGTLTIKDFINYCNYVTNYYTITNKLPTTNYERNIGKTDNIRSTENLLQQIKLTRFE